MKKPKRSDYIEDDYVVPKTYIPALEKYCDYLQSQLKKRDAAIKELLSAIDEGHIIAYADEGRTTLQYYINKLTSKTK